MTRALRAVLLGAVVGLTSRAHLAEAQYNYSYPATWTSGTSLPIGGVLIQSGAVVLQAVAVNNQLGGQVWIQVFDQTTTPSTGTNPVWASPVITNNAVGSLTVPPAGILFKNGLFVTESDVGDSYDPPIGAIPGYYAVQWRKK